MSERNIVTWTALISGYVQNSDPQNAVKMFISMPESGWKPISFTFWAVLNACSDLYDLKLGEQIHACITKSRVNSTVAMDGSLSNMYSKCGNLEYAVKCFKYSEFKDVVSWTSIISACADNGNPGLSLKIFIDMLHENICPTPVTLTSVAGLFCVSQDLQLGPTRQYHAFCIKLGGESIFQVRNSLMYMYVKCGEIEDATRLSENTMNPNLVTINSTIAGLSKMVSSAKDDMRAYSTGLKAFNLFVKLKRSSTKSDRFTFLSVLTVYSGLVPYKTGDKSDKKEERRVIRAVRHHSEKLAVAYGLINMSNGEAIRVFKNISMCKDCHSLLKLVSVLTEREIIEGREIYLRAGEKERK